MKKLLFILLVLPAIFFSCQKEAMELDDVLADLELKSNDDGKETDGKKDGCFEIQFPLTIVMPDDSEITAESREDLANSVKQWFTDNGKKHKKKIDFKYPITVVFKGKTLTLEGERGLERIKMACRGGKDGDKEKVSCVELVYPLTFIMPDRTTLTVDNKKDHAEALKKWFEEHPDFESQRPALQYPVDVIFKGRPMTLENEKEMARLREACAGDKEGNKERKACFEMVYPLNYIMPDGTNVTGSKKEIADAFKTWYAANPDSKERPALQFPIKIEYAMNDRGEGRFVEIASEEQLKRAYKACGGGEGDKERKACFELVYPLAYNMPDGTTISGKSQREIEAAIKRWYESNRSDKRPSLQFPVKINYGRTDKGEKILEIENQKALDKAYADCGK